MKISGALGRALGVLALAAGCNDGGSGGEVKIASTGKEMVFGITASNRLISFDPGAVKTLLSTQAVTGLAAGEKLLAIDYRPGTGQLYALGSTSRLYTIDTASAVATAVGAGPFAPALLGTDFGFDFDPVADQIRVVSDADLDLRLDPDTGAVESADAALAYAAGDANSGADPTIVGAAYTSDFPGATSTTLYAIDSGLDVLVTQGSPGGMPVSPDLGTLFTVGPLAVNTLSEVALDVSPFGGAFAIITVPPAKNSALFTVNLATGAATVVGTVGGAEVIRDIAVVPPAAPRVFAITTANDMVSFRPAVPGTLLDSVAVTGLLAGENLLGIDFRPATGQLFGLADTSRVYTIDTTSGFATEVGAGPFAPALAGTDFGVDFDPVLDRLRVVGDADQNLRLDPTSGAVDTDDTALAYDALDANALANPAVVASAYTSNVTGSVSTTLFGIDSDLDVLVRQGSAGGTPTSPDDGKLFTIGALGADTSGLSGLDVSFFGGALASLTAPAGTESQLHRVDLATGSATLVGTIGGGVTARDLAIEPPFAPILYAVTGGNVLVSFVAGAPDTLLASVAITGLQAAETVLALDSPPSTRALVALGSSSRIYALDRTSGVATAIGTAAFSPALAGMEHGFEFNPVNDRIRVVGDADQNLRLNAASGAVTNTDSPLTYDAADPNTGADPSIVALAHTSNFIEATSTTLFGIDSELDVLVTLGSPGGTPARPDEGLLFTVGPLGVDAAELAGFDIALQGGAFAALTEPGEDDSQLYTIDLATGAATLLGTIGGADTIRGLATLPPGL